MTDPMELVRRLDELHAILRGQKSHAERKNSDGNSSDFEPSERVIAVPKEAAACIREMVEQRDRHLEAAFMWAWARGAGTFLQDPDGLAEWRIYRRSVLSPLPPAPGAEA